MKFFTETLPRWWKNVYFRHVCYATSTLICILALCMVLLNVFTEHGKMYQVPDFKGLSLSDAEMLAQKSGVVIVVNDEIYQPQSTPGSVLEQTPAAGQYVKEGRKVFVIINANSAKMVSAPDVIGLSSKQARAIIDGRGFILERIEYVQDAAYNNVLDLVCKGKSLHKGDKIPEGSALKLVLGIQDIEEQTMVPDVIGKRYLLARTLLFEAGLNVSVVKESGTKPESTQDDWYVVAQEPVAADSVVTLVYGSVVNVRVSDVKP